MRNRVPLTKMSLTTQLVMTAELSCTQSRVESRNIFAVMSLQLTETIKRNRHILKATIDVSKSAVWSAQDCNDSVARWLGYWT